MRDSDWSQGNIVHRQAHLGRERRIRFVTATGVSRDSNSKSYECFSCTYVGRGSLLFHGTKPMSGKYRSGANVGNSHSRVRYVRWLLHTAHSICKADSDGSRMKLSGCVLMKRFRTSGHARKQAGSLCARLIEAFRLVYK